MADVSTMVVRALYRRSARLAQPAFHFASKGCCAANLSGALGKHHGGRNGEEVLGSSPSRSQAILKPKLTERSASAIATPGPPSAGAPLGVLARLQGAVGHHHANDAAVLQIEVNAAGKEQPGNVLMGGVLPPCQMP